MKAPAYYNENHPPAVEWLRPHGLAETAFPAQEVREIIRIAAWSGFGNAIVPPLAAEVIGALMDVLPEWKGAI